MESQPSKVRCYLLPGWGADKRLFQKLSFPDFLAIEEIIYPTPQFGESLEEYGKRLAKTLKLISPFVLIGVSLGGIFAVELNKYIHPEKTILISTVKTKNEIPSDFGFTNLFGLLQSGFNVTNPINSLKHFMGDISDRDWALMLDMYQQSDKVMMSWAMMNIPLWKNTTLPNNYIHIHGTDDLLFPIKHIQNCLPIQHGGHLMVLTHAKEISRLIGG